MMARRLFVSVLLIGAVAGLHVVQAQGTELEIGAATPLTDVAMQDVSGDFLTLAEIAGEQGLLVIFSCATCPYVKAWEDRYATLAETAETLGIGMVALNPNTAYRNRGDSFEDMQAQAETQGYTFPYLLDEDNNVADAFGATRTPHVFLFDADLTLQYRGAIDDHAQSVAGVRTHYTLDAMQAMVAGNALERTTTRSVGCSIKRL